MAFHITQCPCCSSTFSISAQLLNAANGKVRCGACLSVFLAEQQLVDSEPVPDGSESNDSVFIGHAPEDYFDPASFLTREALQQQSINSRAATEEPKVTGNIEAKRCSTSMPAVSQSSDSQESDEECRSATDLAAEAGLEKDRTRPRKTSAMPAEQTNHNRQGRELPDKLPPDRKSALEALQSALHRGSESDPANKFRPDQQPSRIDMETAQPAIAQRDAALNALDSFRSKPRDSLDSTRQRAKADDIGRYPEVYRSNKGPLPDTVSESAKKPADAETAGSSAEKKTFSRARQAPAVPEPPEVSKAQHAEPATHDPSPKEADNGIACNQEEPDPDGGPVKTSLIPEKLQHADAAIKPFSDAVTEQKADDQHSSRAIRARALKMELIDEQAPEQFATENLASLQAVATSIELHSVSHTRWRRTLTLLLSAGLLGISLAGQHLWRNQEHYSQQTRWRPLLEWVCVNSGCDLPLYEDLAAIEPSNLSVSSHPNRANVIMVQVQIRNTAPFEQAFPVMIVGFNTANNDLIALREFSPAEYLHGELPDSATMPVMAPVPIFLELMDPGEDAVNYTLAFRRS